ncbi:MAG TPA: FAD-dependent oxidoreductase [Xanthobacteraceae bacterium]|nr:FAD-dependent oxidoreductase [Xanthobacteraceae bacterium]
MSQTERQEIQQETRSEIKPDLCVIGAGAGGLAAAAAAAAFGVNVVLIDRGPVADGDRSGQHRDAGALASKAFLAAAARAHWVRPNVLHQGVLHQALLRDGDDDAGFAVNYPAVRDYVRDVVAAAAPETSLDRINGLGVRVLQGECRFTDPHTVAVNGYDVRARRFIIATGSAPALPDIPGLADVPYFTTGTVFDLKVCPRHLIVIGAQPIGLELAQAFARFGAAVTVLEAATPLHGVDTECAAIVLDALAREGIAVRAGVEITCVRGEGDGIAADIAVDGGNATIEGSHILVATGRRPNVEALGLDAAGIRHDPSGITVDRGLRTSNRHVYAIGEVAGAAALTHLARHQAGLVVRNALFRTPVTNDSNAVPSVICTDPELAQVGHTEDGARAAVGRIRVLRSAYGENDRARASGTTTGHVKIVTNRKGAILGATIVGAGAAEAIVAWTLAISQRLNIEAMAGVIVPYPAYAEVGKRAAMTYFTRGLTSPLVRRIIVWLRRFG